MSELGEKMVYGGVFHARFHYVKKKFGVLGLRKQLDEMNRAGYDGPQRMRDMKLSSKYPVEWVSIYNEAFVDLFGEKHFARMSRDSASRGGILGQFMKWDETPELVIRNAPEFWPLFYDFGKIKTEVTGEGQGMIQLTDGKIDPLFCKSLTNYFAGIGDAICTSLDVTHTACVFEGGESCEWEVKW
jgi:hypothetical protein